MAEGTQDEAAAGTNAANPTEGAPKEDPTTTAASEAEEGGACLWLIIILMICMVSFMCCILIIAQAEDDESFSDTLNRLLGKQVSTTWVSTVSTMTRRTTMFTTVHINECEDLCMKVLNHLTNRLMIQPYVIQLAKSCMKGGVPVCDRLNTEACGPCLRNNPQCKLICIHPTQKPIAFQQCTTLCNNLKVKLDASVPISITERIRHVLRTCISMGNPECLQVTNEQCEESCPPNGAHCNLVCVQGVAPERATTPNFVQTTARRLTAPEEKPINIDVGNPPDEELCDDLCRHVIMNIATPLLQRIKTQSSILECTRADNLICRRVRPFICRKLCFTRGLQMKRVLTNEQCFKLGIIVCDKIKISKYQNPDRKKIIPPTRAVTQYEEHTEFEVPHWDQSNKDERPSREEAPGNSDEEPATYLDPGDGDAQEHQQGHEQAPPGHQEDPHGYYPEPPNDHQEEPGVPQEAPDQGDFDYNQGEHAGYPEEHNGYPDEQEGHAEPPEDHENDQQESADPPDDAGVDHAQDDGDYQQGHHEVEEDHHEVEEDHHEVEEDHHEVEEDQHEVEEDHHEVEEDQHEVEEDQHEVEEDHHDVDQYDHHEADQGDDHEEDTGHNGEDQETPPEGAPDYQHGEEQAEHHEEQPENHGDEDVGHEEQEGGPADNEAPQEGEAEL